MSTEMMRRRRVAMALVESLLPIVERHLDDIPSPEPVVLRPDADLVKAARRVAEASDRLMQAKYSPAEIPARQALERACVKLSREFVQRRRGRAAR